MTRDPHAPVTSRSGAHAYLSPACHHEIDELAAGGIERAAELHARCGTGPAAAGCPECEARCGCPRHDGGALVAWERGAAETERVLRERYAGLLEPGRYALLRERLGLGGVIDGQVIAVGHDEIERLPVPWRRRVHGEG